MLSPKVSVIVPCYKTEQYLDRCVTSLVNQTLREIEIILVDDGSPDRVPQMCDEWAKKDSRIKVIHKQNAGLGYARNSGMEIATGEYIAFVDSDDWVDTDTYRVAYEEAERDPNLDVVYFGAVYLDKKGNETRYVGRYARWDPGTIKECILDHIATAPHVGGDYEYSPSVWCALIKRTILQTHRLQFLSERDITSEDVLFTYELLSKCKNVEFIPFGGYFYCYNSASLTRTFLLEKYNCLCRLHRLMSKESGDDPQILQRIDRFFIANVRTYVLFLVDSDTPDKLKQLARIVNDGIWKTLKRRYKSGWLHRPYYIITLRLIYSRHLRLLYVWAKLYTYTKKWKSLLARM